MNNLDNFGETKDKLISFIKDKFWFLAVALFSIIFIAYQIADLAASKKTFQEVIADCLLSLSFGVTLRALFIEAGLSDGKKSPKFNNTLIEYANKSASMDIHRHRLDNWINTKNEHRLIMRRSNMLRRQNITYEDYLAGKYKRDKKTLKFIKRVNRTKIYFLSSAIINNPATQKDISEDSDVLKINASKFRFKRTSHTIVITLVFAFLFAYFGLNWTEFTVGSLIWSIFQVIYFLSLGLLEYLKSYTFVVDDLRSKIIQIILYIDEFILTCERTPHEPQETVTQEVLVNMEKCPNAILEMQEEKENNEEEVIEYGNDI